MRNMKKLAIFAIIFLGSLLFSNTSWAKPLTMDEALDAVCRVSTNSARGSGTVFAEDEEKYYVLTNGHVVGKSSRGHLEFFQEGYKSAMIPFKTEYSTYEEGTALDLAVLSVKKKYFGRYPPRVIPLAPKGTVIKPNDLIMGGGCPSAQWACYWKSRVRSNTGAVISFNAAPIGGQSGSGVLILVKDDKGELHSRIGILLAWRVGDGAWSDDGPDDYGAGLSLKQIYEIMDGNGRGYPIETSYNLGYENEKIKKNTKSAEERLNAICPHCKTKIKDNVVIPHNGRLRRTDDGHFMFCPKLKFPDGGVADTAQYYGGIKVGELYEDNGIFPWCPWNHPRPPQPQPPNPGGPNPGGPNPPDGGGGFNPWPGRPDPGPNPPVDPPVDFEKERQEYLDKISQLQEKLTNLESLSETLKAELSGVSGNLSSANNEISGLKDLLGAVEGQKQSLNSRIEQLLVFVKDKDQIINQLKDNSAHYLDEPTGGNGNAVENVGFALGGASLGALALKYGVPLILGRIGRRRRKNGKNVDENQDEGYDNNAEDHIKEDSSTERSNVQKHVHEHEHIHKHKHANDYIVPLDQLPEGKTTNEIDCMTGEDHSSGLNPGFVPYGMPVAEPHYQQPVAAHGLPPQFLHVPFGTRKTVTSEQIMTVFGELVNEYRNDQTMTMAQIDTLLRHRLKERYNIE